MTKRQIRKTAYNSIVKEGKSHQDTFDTITQNTNQDQEWVAKEVAKYPGSLLSENQKTLKMIYIGLLGILVILRCISMIAIAGDGNLNKGILSVFILIAVLIPGLGIYGAVTNKVDVYRSMAILSIIGIARSIQYIDMVNNPISLIGLFPLFGIIILGFYIPTKLRTNYHIKIVEEDNNGETKKVKKYVFDETLKNSSPELLDDI